jgi:alpha-galactosidase
MRALRNVPVLIDIAYQMEALCPDAWLLNLTNPLTVLCRAVSRESTIRTLGLCHEVTHCQHTMSLLLDVDMRELDLEVAGVNHLPVITRFGVGEQDGFVLLRELMDDLSRADEPIASGPGSRGDLLAQNQVKLELFQRFGVLPAAGDRHLVEFFAGFLTEVSDWGARWGVSLTTIEDRRLWAQWFAGELDAMFAAPEITTVPSGEMVAPVIDALMCDHRRVLPLDIPNTGQCPDLSDQRVVESMCVVDGDGVRGRDRVSVPPVLADTLRRVSASQELTLDAALRGDRSKVFEAMLLDPLAGRADFGVVEQMTNEMIEATRAWLPQFA